MVKVGDPAIDFELSDYAGKKIKLSDFKGKNIVLYFYPKDNTPGCTAEACSFRDAYNEYKNIIIIGISKDDAKNHKKFIEKYNLPFILLTDNKKVCEKYDSFGKKKFMGKEYDGIVRKTFIIDKNFKIKYIFDKVKCEVHAKEVLEVING